MYKNIFLIFLTILSLTSGTEVRRCDGGKPFPLAVRVKNCDVPPCDVVKGEDMVFEIDFVAWKDVSHMTTKVKATTLGLTVPYELPDDVSDVCRNLMYGAYCPLYSTEDVTYLFVFPIGNYPEIKVKVEISIVDQDDDTVTCFLCDIKVKKGSSSRTNEGEQR